MKLSPKLRQRLTLIGVFSIFMVPILLALALNLPGVTWRPFGVRNHGELLRPAVLLADFAPQAVDGSGLAENPLVGGWTVLLSAMAPCDSDCEAVIESLQRVRLSLGEHGGRVQMLWLATGDAELDPADVALMRARHPALRVVRAVNTPLPSTLPTSGDGPTAHVIDPRGYLILRYAPGFEARDLLKDLERLLRYSKQP